MSEGAANDALSREAKEWLEAARTRGDIKRLASALEKTGDQALMRAIIREGTRRGANLPPDAINWPAKKLLRVARGNEDSARRRSNPIRRDESFCCENCGAEVTAHGRTARNHCPSCLFSKHVDDVPGDRTARCGGLMPTTGVVTEHGETYLVQICLICGHKRRNRAILDGEEPDNWQGITALAARASR
jgi:hypothetical protein